MNTSLTVLDPTAVGAAPHSADLVPPPAGLDGVRVGVLDNGKPNSDRFLSLLAERLSGLGGLPQAAVRKPSIGRLAPPELVEELLQNSDLVVTGVGDCAGCCSCSVADGVAMERHGVPTVVIVTAEFLTTARIAATAAGIPDYPLVVVDHPLGSLTPDLLAERADHALAQLLDRLGGR